MPKGYLVSKSNLQDMREVVRNYQRTPRTNLLRHKRRQQVFLPSAGNKVYQCVLGTRLRKGTAAKDKDETEKREPVCLAVELGNVNDSKLQNFEQYALGLLRTLVEGSAAVDTDGTINQDQLDALSDDEQIKALIKDQLGESGSVVALRTRFAQGYVASGETVIGNDDEVWIGGSLVWEVELQEKWTNGDGQFYLAYLSPNGPSIDSGDAPSNAERINDPIAVRDPHQYPSIYIPSGKTLLVEFRQQVWFDDDDSYEDQFWFDHEANRLIPIFDLISNEGRELVGKANANATQGATDATASIWTGTSSSGLTDTGDDVDYYPRYGDVEQDAWLALTAYPWGLEGVQTECP